MKKSIVSILACLIFSSSAFAGNPGSCAILNDAILRNSNNNEFVFDRFMQICSEKNIVLISKSHLTPNDCNAPTEDTEVVSVSMNPDGGFDSLNPVGHGPLPFTTLAAITNVNPVDSSVDYLMKIQELQRDGSIKTSNAMCWGAQ